MKYKLKPMNLNRMSKYIIRNGSVPVCLNDSEQRQQGLGVLVVADTHAHAAVRDAQVAPVEGALHVEKRVILAHLE